MLGFLDGLSHVEDWVRSLEERLESPPPPQPTKPLARLFADVETASARLANGLLQLLDYFRERELTGRADVALFMGRLAGLLACLAYSSQEHQGLLGQSGQNLFLA
jgi:hypothetical protein